MHYSTFRPPKLAKNHKLFNLKSVRLELYTTGGGNIEFSLYYKGKSRYKVQIPITPGIPYWLFRTKSGDYRVVPHNIVLDLLRPHKDNQKITQLLLDKRPGIKATIKDLLAQL